MTAATRNWLISLIAGLWILVALIIIVGAVTADPPRANVAQPPDSAWFRRLTPSIQRDSIVAAEARRADVPVALALAVSHTENWTGDSAAVSSAGAVGLMQVLPRVWQHSFEQECGCGSLAVRRVNACKGVRILRFYLDSLPTVDQALRSYHGSNKPRLHLAGDEYVASVLDRMFPRDGTVVTWR